MGAAEIATLIVQFGIPFTEYMIQLIENKTTVTATEWANLKLLAGASAKSELLDRLKLANIDPASPQAVALLALVN